MSSSELKDPTTDLKEPPDRERKGFTRIGRPAASGAVSTSGAAVVPSPGAKTVSALIQFAEIPRGAVLIALVTPLRCAQLAAL